jgi:hypothetical protein
MKPKKLRSVSTEVPILFLVFNRPESTGTVFEAIRSARPKYLYVAADGPREGHAAEAEACGRTREIVSKIDWPCRTVTLFRERNLGCRDAVSQALTWFFERVERGIVLEDDCLPDASFFGFCEKLLERYATDSRVMMISGDNFLRGAVRGEGSYYFTRYPHIWGWATWRRAWRYYDVDMSTFPAFRDQSQMELVAEERVEQEYWLDKFEKVYRHELDTWDYQWVYALFCQSGLSINPAVNLVSNIGFAPDALHTKDLNSSWARMETQPIGRIVHPRFIIRDVRADRYTVAHVLGLPARPSGLARFARLLRTRAAK